MKIQVMTVAVIPPEYEAHMTAQLEALYRPILRADTVLAACGMARGTEPKPEYLPDYRSPYYELLLRGEVVRAALAAEAAGFDAFVVNCFDDPGVREARAVVNIPVFGICEPSLHLVCQLGGRFGALVPDLPGQVACVEGQIAAHGLRERLLPGGVRTETRPYVETQPEAASNPEPVAAQLAVLGERLIRDGADAVLIACGGLGNTCDRAGLHRLDIDGHTVPVVTPLTVALKHVEMLLDLARVNRMPLHSRAHAGAVLSAADRARIQQGFGEARDE